MESFRYLDNVATLALNEEKCVGCGTCTNVCPHGVFEIREGTAKVIDKNGCMECGACTLNCPALALDVHPGVGCAALMIKTWLHHHGFSRSTKCC